MAGWDWLSRVDLEVYRIGFGSFTLFRLLFVHSDTRYVFHESSLTDLDLYVWLRLLNKLVYSGFPVRIHKFTVTHDFSALYCKSRLYRQKKEKLKLVILFICPAHVLRYVLTWIENGIDYKRAMASCHFQPDLARKQELLALKLLWFFVPQKLFGSQSQDLCQTLICWKLFRSHV